jgi:hypothetical protein
VRPLGILADLLRNKAAAKVDKAMTTVKETSDDLSRAVDRLDRIVRSTMETTVDRAFAENARLTGRKRRQ